MIRKSFYGNYTSVEAGVNCLSVEIGKLKLWFSYDEVIAFRFEDIKKVLTDEEISH